MPTESCFWGVRNKLPEVPYPQTPPFLTYSTSAQLVLIGMSPKTVGGGINFLALTTVSRLVLQSPISLVSW